MTYMGSHTVYRVPTGVLVYQQEGMTKKPCNTAEHFSLHNS